MWSGVEDTVIEGNVIYRLIQATLNHVYVIGNGDTALLSDNDAIVPQQVQELDLDQDGFDDVIVNLFSNTPGEEEQYLHDPSGRRFDRLENASYYMNTQPLRGTGYCWTYNRAGCADYSWESWLFGIANGTAYSLAHIEARICPGYGDAKVLVYRAIDNKDIERVDSIPADTSIEFQREKGTMIEEYWTKHYKLFIRRS